MAKKNNNKFMIYWGKHAHYTSFVHTALGVGVGLLAQPYLVASNLSEVVGWVLVLLGVLGHLYAMVA